VRGLKMIGERIEKNDKQEGEVVWVGKMCCGEI